MSSAETVFVGIDIGKYEFDVFVFSNQTHQCYTNNNQGFQAFADWLQTLGPSIHLVCEATGGYEDALACFLAQRGYELNVCNPRNIRHFGHALGLLAKTDRQDAKLIARYAQTLKPAMRRKQVERFDIHKLYQRKKQTKNLIQEETNRLEQASENTAQFIHEHLKFLKRQLKQIEEQLDQHMQSDDTFQHHLDILTSCQGVGQETAQALLMELPEIGHIDKKAVASLVGVAPFNNDTGRQRGKRSIWGGRQAVRKKLYMAALVASQHNPTIKTFYQKLVAKGKEKKVALVACMKKLIIILNAMIQNNTYWQPQNH